MFLLQRKKSSVPQIGALGAMAALTGGTIGGVSMAATKEEPDISAIDESKHLTDIGEGDEDENKPNYDHTPHDMFVQLSEINDEHTFWEEKSRWIKYEECKEEGKFQSFIFAILCDFLGFDIIFILPT